MAKRDTRQLIADAFVDAVRKTSLSRVRIADLIEQLGINRNTYYYHFSSKHETALWVFRRALHDQLCELLPKEQLVSMPFSKRIPQELALYSHIEIGARTLDASLFMKGLLQCVASDPTFYRKLFTVMEPEFVGTVERMYYPLLVDDITFILDGRYMPKETLALVATLSVRSLVGTVEFFLQNPSMQKSLLDERVNPFVNALQESLFEIIQAHPINRYAQRAR
ncbi:MAG TPA: hypothetical protein IAC28_03390 [Candidatus Aphodovivens excrementavium]|nr:hypothetical protein [Candidatus Aphodovivens excrementavium]